MSVETPSAATTLLAELVRLDSSNPPGQEPQVASALAERLEQIGFQVRLDPVIGERANLHAWLGQETGGLAFVSHLDTVPAGQGWKSDPFDPVIRDGALVGLGACDPKASFASFIVACARLIETGWNPRHGIQVVGLVDEEERQQGVRAWVERANRSELPSFAIVGEPTRLDVVCAHKGDLYVEVEFRGLAAHSSDPEAGSSALYPAAELALEIERLHAERSSAMEPEHPLTGWGTWSVGISSGGSGISIVPEHALVQIDRRFNPSDDPERSVEIVRRVADQIAARRGRLTAETRTLQVAPAMETDPSTPAVVALLESAAAVTGRRDPIGWGATCDANMLSQSGVPVVVFGPGDLLAAAHRPNESVPLAEVERAVDIFAAAIPRIDELVAETKQEGGSG
jgi:acetylornithine deacetylase/succinyl-diaminopimelate desuccinylase-like protein